MARDLKRIERYYRARGYYEAKVSAARVIPTANRHVRVEIRVEEGDPVIFKNIQIKGLEEIPVDISVEAIKAVQLRQNERFDEADFEAAARDLSTLLRLTVGMVITRGADGSTIATADGMTAHCPAPAITDVYDTVGAGDTAVAVLTLALAAGASLAQAAVLANYASGVVVRRVGNYAPTIDELNAAMQQAKPAPFLER